MTKQPRICSPKQPGSESTYCPTGGSLLATIVIMPVLLCAPVYSADPSFEFTATDKDFSLYFPAYLANGFFTTTTSLRGSEATDAYMVGVMDYTPGDVSRPAAIPS
jgi:hypothetical protein